MYMTHSLHVHGHLNDHRAADVTAADAELKHARQVVLQVKVWRRTIQQKYKIIIYGRFHSGETLAITMFLIIDDWIDQKINCLLSDNCFDQKQRRIIERRL